MISEKNDAGLHMRLHGIHRNSIACLAVVVMALFAATLGQRASWFGEPGVSMAAAMTAGTAGMARQWYEEGACRLGFMMYWEPASIETPDLASRTPYASYPPGAIVPIYLLARLTQRPPGPALVMGYNLANQGLIALFLGLMAYLVTVRLGHRADRSWLFAAIPPLLYLWMPSPFYEHQMGFFADHAVILPWVLFVFLEILRVRETPKNTRCLLNGAEVLVAFWGTYTDWLFPIVALCAYTVRLTRGQIPLHGRKFVWKSMAFWFPVLLALGIFILQVYQAGALSDMLGRFVYRSGMDGNADRLLRKAPESWQWQSLFLLSLTNRFWTSFIPQGYGPWGKPLILIAVLGIFAGITGLGIRNIRARKQPETGAFPPVSAWADAVSAMFMLLVPCLLHVQLLKEHSSFFLHSFAALKFAVPLAIIPLAIGPAAVLRMLPQGETRMARSIQGAIPLLCVLLASAYTCFTQPEREGLFAQNQPNPYRAPGAFVAAHTRYEDVVVSNNFGIPRNFIVYSMKQVHEIQDIEDIQRVVADIQGNYVLNLFSNGPEQYEPTTGLAALAAIATESHDQGEYHLRRIPRAAFEKLYPVPNIESPVP